MLKVDEMIKRFADNLTLTFTQRKLCVHIKLWKNIFNVISWKDYQILLAKESKLNLLLMRRSEFLSGLKQAYSPSRKLFRL